MSFLVLYGHGTAAGPSPAPALQIAADSMIGYIDELERDHTFVAVQGHSHAVTPLQVADPPGSRTAPGFTVTITAIAEVS